jgi:mRNA-degrading endonuclease RelE of RelBE toxin-antitoxin system
MGWKIEYKPTAEKQYRNLDRKIRKKVKKALRELEDAHDPEMLTNVRAQTVTLYGDFWLSVDKWRVLFTPDKEKESILIFGIIPEDDFL